MGGDHRGERKKSARKKEAEKICKQGKEGNAIRVQGRGNTKSAKTGTGGKTTGLGDKTKRKLNCAGSEFKKRKNNKGPGTRPCCAKTNRGTRQRTPVCRTGGKKCSKRGEKDLQERKKPLRTAKEGCPPTTKGRG